MWSSSLDSLWTGNAETSPPPGGPIARSSIGPPTACRPAFGGASLGWLEGSREFHQPWDGFRAAVNNYIELDDNVLWYFTAPRAGRGKTSGLDMGRISSEGTTLFQLRYGKVIRYVVWFDRARALADLGACAGG